MDTDSIVKELNQKHSKKIAEKKQSAPEKAKSLDEIVDKATEEADPKKRIRRKSLPSRMPKWKRVWQIISCRRYPC